MKIEGKINIILSILLFPIWGLIAIIYYCFCKAVMVVRMLETKDN